MKKIITEARNTRKTSTGRIDLENSEEIENPHSLLIPLVVRGEHE